MRRTRFAFTLIFVLALAAAALGDPITGTVTNGTTGKPAAGVTVTLVDPMGGMAEVATAKSDAKGQFTVEAPAARGPRLVRAERSGVNYFKMITPGTSSIDLSVYDAVSSLQGIKGSADVVRLQTQGSTLQAVEMFAVNNDSNPPRTLAAPATFEFVLPDGAAIDEVHAQAPNGQPITVEAKPTGTKNHYAFSFALKPGESRLQVNYHLPYSGQASFSPQFTRDFEHFVVLMPSSMSFTPKDAKQYQAMTNQPGTNVQVSLQAQAGSGPELLDRGQRSVSGRDGFAGRLCRATALVERPHRHQRPRRRTGRPEDGPDGLAKYRWFILAALVAVLIGGGIWTHERTLQDAPQTAVTAPPVAAYAATSAVNPAPAASLPAAAESPAPSNLLLTALKEEMFTLEVEHQQGKLSQQEYEKARAALEQTLQRALARSKS